MAAGKGAPMLNYFWNEASYLGFDFYSGFEVFLWLALLICAYVVFTVVLNWSNKKHTYREAKKAYHRNYSLTHRRWAKVGGDFLKPGPHEGEAAAKGDKIKKSA